MSSPLTGKLAQSRAAVIKGKNRAEWHFWREALGGKAIVFVRDPNPGAFD